MGITERSIQYYSILGLLKAEKNVSFIKVKHRNIVLLLSAKLAGHKLKDLIGQQPSLGFIKK